ncbi:MAG: ectoine/hydroxyectoine ABC transporter permease subunit EhuD [Actinomycetia bacterium]|nr:ectoine/hydroxyectoine ABC transporter permease subunit EhuD [Actinomycetes bacterium]
MGRWDTDYAIEILPALLDGLWITVKLTLSGMALALVLGLVVAVLRYLRIPVISRLLTFYVLFIRGTPLLIQAFFLYYVFPEFGLTLPTFTTGIIILGVNYSGYTAEVYRAGIEGLPKGQWEACTALSLPRWRSWTKIVLPQSIATVIPVLGNYLIQMFKDSAVLYAITVVELLRTAYTIGQNDARYIEPLTIAGLLYLIVSYIASLGVKRLERRYAPTH